MRILKLGLISIIFLSFLITGISLFFPSRVRISKAIEISGTKEKVMQQIANTDNWRNWYPGIDSIKDIAITEKNDSSVRASISGPNSKKIELGWNIYSFSTNQPVTLQWYMDFHLRWYPWEKFSSLLLERSFGPRMEKGLTDLKRIIESSAEPLRP